MRLVELQSVGFRSYPQLDVRFGPGVNLLVGANGAGKTNILDMIYFLSMCKGPRRMPDTASIRHGAEAFSLYGRYSWGQGQDLGVSLGLRLGQGKEVRHEGRGLPRLADHIGRIPLVAMYPHDTAMIVEGGDLRRRFLNALIAQYDRAYLLALAQYERVLLQRNSYLKSEARMDEDLLSVYDAQLVEAAAPIHTARAEACGALQPIFQELYSELSPGGEEVALRYDSHAGRDELAGLLAQRRERDRRFQFTSVGIHRDDVRFTLGGHPLRHEGSQGQQKTFVLALRLAQHRFLRTHLGLRPILLLDDLFDRLDGPRTVRIIRLLGDGDFGQVFVTDTDQARANPLCQGHGSVLRVGEGRIEYQTP